MELRDLVASSVLPEMAYTQKKAERILTALEQPLNDHLLQLWTMPNSAVRSAWVADLINWIDEIAEIVLRPANTRPPHIFYYKLLFFEPFGGGAGIANILRRLRRLHRRGLAVQVDVAPEAILQRLQGFHRDLSGLCATKMISEDQIGRLLEAHSLK